MCTHTCTYKGNTWTNTHSAATCTNAHISTPLCCRCHLPFGSVSLCPCNLRPYYFTRLQLAKEIWSELQMDPDMQKSCRLNPRAGRNVSQTDLRGWHGWWWFTSDVTRTHHILLASTPKCVKLCKAWGTFEYWKSACYRIEHVVWFIRCDVHLIYPVEPNQHPPASSHSNAIVPCVVNQAHLQYFNFKWPWSAAIVSHILWFYCRIQNVGGDAAVAVSWLVTFHWRSQQNLVPVWEIIGRPEEAGRGESWSWPQIVALEALTALPPPMMVVCGGGGGGIHFTWLHMCKRHMLIETGWKMCV